MPEEQPDAVMIFAAGFGTRMGALTRDLPKPLIEVAGRALLDRALDLADEAGVARRAINLHYLADRVRAHLAGRAGVCFSEETPEILDTGGGLRAALPLLGPGPVFTLNPDAVWTGENPLCQLARSWDPARMDALLLLIAPDAARCHAGRGDFVPDDAGRLRRRGADRADRADRAAGGAGRVGAAGRVGEVLPDGADRAHRVDRRDGMVPPDGTNRPHCADRAEGTLPPDSGALLDGAAPAHSAGCPDGARPPDGCAMVYTGAQITRTDGLADFAPGAFSLNRLWDGMIARGRLYGIVHEGGWVDVGTPEGLSGASAMLGGGADA